MLLRVLLLVFMLLKANHRGLSGDVALVVLFVIIFVFGFASRTVLLRVMDCS